MTNIGGYISELIQVWRVRCGKCGETQIVTTTYKADADRILKNTLSWTNKASTGWRCPKCQGAAFNDPLRWDMDH